ncbi:uncharacterized protein K02A2.6-like [Armigeres subalbatus]|uniref:uncharacterized protein K02A2.6-like n=1 Tax=Armigeres subalbatus TaxID=124917 RepID=UPI002ED31AE4
MNIADILSRLVIDNQQDGTFDDSSDEHLLFVLDVANMEINWNQIETEAEVDKELNDIRESLKTSLWNTDHQAYECQAKYMRVLGALVFKEDRVILPFKLRVRAMELAHQGHIGASSMKRILRNHFWWPGIGKEVQQYVDKCETCLRLSKKDAPLPLTSRELPQGPWEILQIDFYTDKDFGYGEFLVVVDTYSRYIHVIEMKHIDGDTTNSALLKIFEVWGYPLAIQSDNGPPFQSDNFVKTWENRGIKIRKSIPLSAQSNGAVERQNVGIKHALAAAKLDKVNWRNALEKYVHTHNKVRPLSRLGVTPFELLVGWKFRGTFPCLWETNNTESLDRTDIKEKDAISKLKSKKYADNQRGAKDSDLQVGDTVLVAIQKSHKSDPEFSAERYSIIARDGARVIIRSRRGIQYARNVQDVKKVPQCLEKGTDQSNTGSNKLEKEDNIPCNSENEKGIEDPISGNIQISERPKRTTKKPNKLKDMVLFTIFE